MKTFKFAGVSTRQTQTRVRVANSLARIRVLEQNGHTCVDLVELPTPMTKQQVGFYLRAIDFGSSPAEKAAIAAWNDKYNSSPLRLEIEDIEYESNETIATRAKLLLSSAISKRCTESARSSIQQLS